MIVSDTVEVLQERDRQVSVNRLGINPVLPPSHRPYSAGKKEEQHQSCWFTRFDEFLHAPCDTLPRVQVAQPPPHHLGSHQSMIHDDGFMRFVGKCDRPTRRNVVVLLVLLVIDGDQCSNTAQCCDKHTHASINSEYLVFCYFVWGLDRHSFPSRRKIRGIRSNLHQNTRSVQSRRESVPPLSYPRGSVPPVPYCSKYA